MQVKEGLAFFQIKKKKYAINAKKAVGYYVLNRKLLEPGAEPFRSQWQHWIHFLNVDLWCKNKKRLKWEWVNKIDVT